MARSKWLGGGSVLVLLTGSVVFSLQGGEPPCNVSPASKTWTTDEDFEDGFGINTRVIGQSQDASLTISEVPQLLDDIWIACSSRGTIVRINTQTRQVVGEYLSSPQFATGAMLS